MPVRSRKKAKSQKFLQRPIPPSPSDCFRLKFLIASNFSLYLCYFIGLYKEQVAYSQTMIRRKPARRVR